MQGRRFDRWTAELLADAATRRRLIQALPFGLAPLPLSQLTLDVAAKKKKKRKKRKKKDRCKKSFDSCSGANKCCSKRCCPNSGVAGRFCGPKGSTCCPEGGACSSDFPVCCDPDIVFGCTTPERPVCCAPTIGYPDGYSCLPGYECCVDVNGDPACCELAGVTGGTGGLAAPASLEPGVAGS